MQGQGIETERRFHQVTLLATRWPDRGRRWRRAPLERHGYRAEYSRRRVGMRRCGASLDSDAARASGRVFVISGPSGVGKDTIKNCLREIAGFRSAICVTATTRPARPGEHAWRRLLSSLTEDEFEAKLDRRPVHRARRRSMASTGTASRSRGCGRACEAGHDVLVTPDVKGAATLRALIPRCHLDLPGPAEPGRVEATARRSASSGRPRSSRFV